LSSFSSCILFGETVGFGSGFSASTYSSLMEDAADFRLGSCFVDSRLRDFMLHLHRFN